MNGVVVCEIPILKKKHSMRHDCMDIELDRRKELKKNKGSKFSFAH
jgi:hypothetical protein